MSEPVQTFGSETATFGNPNLGFGGEAIGDSVAEGDIPRYVQRERGRGVIR